MTPEPPVDLLLPERSSSTSRALRSLALRGLFDYVAHTPRPDAGPRYDAFRRAVSSFLPGQPRAVTALLDEPGISMPLRQLRRGAGDARALGDRIAAEAAFVLEVRAQRPATFDLDPAGGLCFDPPRARCLPIAGRSLVLAAEASPFFAGPRALSDEALAELVGRLRRAHALLSRTMPGTAESLERLARVVAPSSSSFAFNPDAITVFGIDPDATEDALARALAASTVTLQLACAHERDEVGSDAAFAALDEAGRALLVHELSRRLGVPSADEVAALEDATARLDALREALSPFGRGVYDELLGYVRPTRAP